MSIGYSIIPRSLWEDADFCGLALDPQFVWFRLATGPECCPIPGVLPRCGVGALHDSMVHRGWPFERTQTAFGELVAQGWVREDRAARLVWLPRVSVWRPVLPRNPNQILHWGRTWRGYVPDCPLKVEIRATIREAVARLGDGFLAAFESACPQVEASEPSEPEHLPPSPEALVFKVRRRSGRRGPTVWAPTDNQIEGWKAAFPSIDVLRELRALAVELEAQSKFRRVPHRMPALITKRLAARAKPQKSGGPPANLQVVGGGRRPPRSKKEAEDYVGELQKIRKQLEPKRRYA